MKLDFIENFIFLLCSFEYMYALYKLLKYFLFSSVTVFFFPQLFFYSSSWSVCSTTKNIH